MSEKRFVRETALAALAQHYRLKAKKTRAQAAREMQVSQTSIFNAEESSGLSLVKLRVRMIEAYSPYAMEGAYFLMKRKKSASGSRRK